MKQIILITGATSGIGEAIARKLATEGNHLILIGRNKKKLDQLKKELEAQCDSLIVYDGNLADKSAVEDIRRTYSKNATVIVNCAAEFGPTVKLTEMRAQDLDFAWKVNVVAPILLVQRALNNMIEKGFGRIINISSSAGIDGYALRTPYAATKSALISFTKTLNKEITSGVYGKVDNVCAFCLCPGPVKGKRLEKQILERATYKKVAVSDMKERFRKIQGSILEPEEIVDWVVALTEPGANRLGHEIIQFGSRTLAQ